MEPIDCPEVRQFIADDAILAVRYSEIVPSHFPFTFSAFLSLSNGEVVGKQFVTMLGEGKKCHAINTEKQTFSLFLLNKNISCSEHHKRDGNGTVLPINYLIMDLLKKRYKNCMQPFDTSGQKCTAFFTPFVSCLGVFAGL